jgi:hypothetical protein
LPHELLEKLAATAKALGMSRSKLIEREMLRNLPSILDIEVAARKHRGQAIENSFRQVMGS